ncbi:MULTISPECIES: serine hydrolase domain-containing protein [Pacificimonas]|uniref:Beta-lactamase family protein n=1 Tax=Pacificimonas aurantium TaxID=1250540 RepID=A0ABS7WLN0_9SPHN|nr:MULTISPECIES: serine hydrolase domain-containing protein [Pacificimonas]MBZ6379290.1 beta-lactamase family protein [Pacificimonas aurantium]
MSLTACAATDLPPAPADPAAPVTQVETRYADVAAKAEELVAQPGIAGIGIGVIEKGELVWTGYFGQQGPGIPVTEETMFNTASVAKTVITETVLRLVDQGRVSLDEPIAAHYRHPDLSADPRYNKLTPRLLLSHQSGLLNWPYMYDDGKLAFINDPGSGEIDYSGAGIRILARFLEAKFGKSYPELVEDVLFEPLGVSDMAVARTAELEGRVPHPRTPDGQDHQPFLRSEGGSIIEVGDWSAADNLFASVEGYAGFLTALMSEKGAHDPAVAAERQSLQSTSDTAPGYVCVMPPEECPDPIGFGIGWQVFGEPDRTILYHGGNDFGEHAHAYFAPRTGDGLVLFINGGNAWIGALNLMERIDPDLLMAKHYRTLLTKMREEEAAAAEAETND